ncbi:hypothetical protein CMV_021281 [Castanea mollissima]|uniref:Uncharacterized protein n=1 Tax=Castanea mollissima TaxID=60419 RepID=A0A8J4QWF8_9ROSI|nr:hypothetical protein CMV_021281 [Castanea mollissima]
MHLQQLRCRLLPPPMLPKIGPSPPPPIAETISLHQPPPKRYHPRIHKSQDSLQQHIVLGATRRPEIFFNRWVRLSVLSKENWLRLNIKLKMKLKTIFQDSGRRLSLNTNTILWATYIEITKSDDTIFHLAAYNKLEKIFERLLELLAGKGDLAQSSLELVNMNKDTVLHIAASVGSETMCRNIIDTAESKKLLSCRNKDGETPLFSAVLHGHKDVFLYLHSICGPEDGYDYCSREDGENILHCAIAEEYYDLSLVVLRLYGGLVNLANKDGMTPLHLLASKPSAFKSGCELGWFENYMYHCKYTVKFS